MVNDPELLGRGQFALLGGAFVSSTIITFDGSPALLQSGGNPVPSGSSFGNGARSNCRVSLPHSWAQFAFHVFGALHQHLRSYRPVAGFLWAQGPSG
jgi:hypothetical protein